MFYIIEKFQKRTEELKIRRYSNLTTIAPFAAMDGTLPKDQWYTNVPEEVAGKWFDVNDHFVGRDRYLWLEKDVLVPQPPEGFEVVGLFDFGQTGHGNNRGFESLLFVNKHPYQGVDTNHTEVFFDGFETEQIKLTFLLWTGLEGGGAHHTFYHQCKQADFAFLHKKTDELYYFSLAIVETLNCIGQNAEVYAPLVALLDRVFRLIRWEEDAEFYASVDLAHTTLMDGLSKLEKRSQITVHAVGHTHIDVAWLWRLKHTREKAQRSFATVLRLMERYDEYVFLQTQPQLYKYIKQDCPELYEKIQKKIAQGKWETDGGMWVEADCNLTSGESLVRQFLYGTRFIEQEFGKKCTYLWLPDVFGYSWALPQILKQCELDTFMTTKISWNQYNTIPNDLFWWRGIDGSEVLTYFVDTPMGWADAGGRFSTYNGLMEPGTVIGNWQRFKNKDLTRDTLISYGYGDGGGGVNRDMLEMRRAMDAIPGCPNLKTDKAGEFFRKIHDNIENTDRYVHTWDGELYLEYHRGTYTTQGYNKKTNRKLENRLIQLEWLSSLAYILGGTYAQDKLHDSWECVLLHQFHDIIPGSSIREVYEDSHINYEKTEQRLNEVENIALQQLQKDTADQYTVYSSNSFAGSELVHIPQSKNGRFLDADGNVLPSQKEENGYLVMVQTVPFSGVALRFEPCDCVEEETCFAVSENTLQTLYYCLSWNEQGHLTQIYDKEANRQVLRPGALGNVFEIYEDKPINYDAWDIDIFYGEKMEHPKLSRCVEVIELGNLRSVLRFTYQYRASKIVQDLICYRDSKRIDFETYVDWHEDHKLLKTAFYTNIRSTKATYDIQFGHVERPTHWNNSWDWARFEVCAHKWADLSENGYGISLLNDCKYGHNIKDNAMKLSLLKSSKAPDTEADMGEHTFIYSLYPHIGTVVSGGTIEEANRLNLPAKVVSGQAADLRRLVCLSNEQVMIDAVKKAEDEDCFIVRLHECRGGRTQVTLYSDYPVRRIVPCNMLEHDTGVAVEENNIALEFGPFEIKNFKLYM